MIEFVPLAKTHIFLIQQWRNQQMDVLRQKTRLTRAGQIKWFAGLKDDSRQKLFAMLGEVNAKKGLIGYCGLTNMDLPNRRAEVSFLLATERTKDSTMYRKDMLAALGFLASYAFEERGFNKIFTETFAFRRKHIGILEHFGLKREGVLRNHVFINGRYYDSIMHGLLAREYL